VDIALTLGPNGATPFYAFLDAAGLGPDDVTHGTFDLNPEIVAAIENGTSMFGIDQQPFLQGYGAVMMLTHDVDAAQSPKHRPGAAGHGDGSGLCGQEQRRHCEGPRWRVPLGQACFDWHGQNGKG
jgi:hypothetical protein